MSGENPTAAAGTSAASVSPRASSAAHAKTTPAPGRPPQHALGKLRFANGPDRTSITELYADYPLKLLYARRPGPAAWIYASSYGGGLVDGDRVDITVHVESQASGVVATQASTKVYRGQARQQLTATVEDDGLLVVAPDPVVCFADASYRQRMTFDLAPRASLVLIDWFTAGRVTHGERWAFKHLESRTHVRVSGREIIRDALLLSPLDGDLATRMGSHNVLATAVVIGPALSAHAAKLAKDVAGLPLEPGHEPLMSCSPVASGVILRMAGSSVDGVGRELRARLSFLGAILGGDPWRGRI
jgi:urease accessory protein